MAVVSYADTRNRRRRSISPPLRGGDGDPGGASGFCPEAPTAKLGLLAQRPTGEVDVGECRGIGRLLVRLALPGLRHHYFYGCGRTLLYHWELPVV